MKVLGIETSCDETAVAIFDSDKGLIGESVFSQIDLHSEYGGVIPELASRDHCKKIIQIYKHALGAIDPGEIDYVAYTAGPGLLGALLIGENFAQGLALSLNKPLIPVNHLEAHLMAPFLDEEKVEFPFLTLLVSGGHSLIIDVKGLNQYEILGQSRDDAVGEAFDKTAKLLGIEFPGGPQIEVYAKKGDPNKYKLPKPIFHKGGCNLSFAGLKTAVLKISKQIKTDQEKYDLAASFQKTIEEILYKKSKIAFEEFKKMNTTNKNKFVVAGGVAANKRIREVLTNLCKEEDFEAIFPPINLCGDNAAMIAMVGLEKFKLKQFSKLDSPAKPRWPLDADAAFLKGAGVRL